MAVTRLGWDILKASSSRLVNFTWVTGKVRKGDAFTILNYFASEFNKRVEKIERSKSWGYSSRDVRGAAGIASEHSAGTAVDFNAPDHWLGEVGTFNSLEIRELRKILKELDGVIRWGGDYSGRKDEMHFELQGGVKKLEAVASKIKGGSTTPAKPKDNTKPKPTGKQWPQGSVAMSNVHTASSHKAWVKLLKDVGYSNSDLTKNFQKWLKDLGYYKGLVDGNFGPMSVKSLQTFLKKKGFYKGVIDGKRQSMTVMAEISYLNSQAKFYN